MDTNGSVTTVNSENSPDSSTRHITPEQMREAWIRVTEQADEWEMKHLAERKAAREAQRK